MSIDHDHDYHHDYHHDPNYPFLMSSNGTWFKQWKNASSSSSPSQWLPFRQFYSLWSSDYYKRKDFYRFIEVNRQNDTIIRIKDINLFRRKPPQPPKESWPKATWRALKSSIEIIKNTWKNLFE
jgi:hypothetical protein